MELQKEGITRFGDNQPDRPSSVKSRTAAAVKEERHTVEQPPVAAPTTSIPMPTVDTTDGPKFPLVAITASVDQSSPFLPSSPQAAQGPFTAPPSSGNQSDYFSGSHHAPARRESSVQIPPAAALPTSPTSPTSNNFMNRLKNLSVKAKLSRVPTNEDNKLPTNEPLAPTTSTTSIISPNNNDDQHQHQQQQQQQQQRSTTPTTETTSKLSEESKLQDIEESKSEFYSPPQPEDFPPLEIPSSTMIIVAEESAEASTGMDLYRGTVGSVGEDANAIIDVAPSWLLSFLLYVS